MNRDHGRMSHGRNRAMPVGIIYSINPVMERSDLAGMRADGRWPGCGRAAGRQWLGRWLIISGLWAAGLKLLKKCVKKFGRLDKNA